MPELVEFQIAKLKVESGDLLVLKFNGRMTDEIAMKIKAIAKANLPDGVKTMVIDQSLDLSVLTFEEIESRKLGNAA